jgi:hypothetical protein
MEKESAHLLGGREGVSEEHGHRKESHTSGRSRVRTDPAAWGVTVTARVSDASGRSSSSSMCWANARMRDASSPRRCKQYAAFARYISEVFPDTAMLVSNERTGAYSLI